MTSYDDCFDSFRLSMLLWHYSSAFGPTNENGIFAGDITSGTLFYFDPTTDRTGINLEGDPLLSDLIADSDDELSAAYIWDRFHRHQ
jgi:aldose sugar dehydrogenase